MAYLKLALRPGIDKQNTQYGAEGGWTDCDYVRFRYGLPEKLGGWTPFTGNKFYLIGQTSEVHAWRSLDGTPYVIAGTNKKLYVNYGGTWTDITPIRATTSAGDVTFAATDGSTTVVVSDTAHGALEGDFVTFSGAATLGGTVTAAVLNTEWEIGQVLDDDTYEIYLTTAANASDTGNGGASVVGTYQINAGSNISFFDFGWGTGSWGLSTWGTPRPAGGTALHSRVWQFDNYGEDVVCQLVGGPTYYWDTSAGVGTRATALADSPTLSNYALVSTPDRHLICFGTETTVGDANTHDPMFVRFSDQENISEFEETVTNTAGGQRLTDGNEIVGAIRSRGQILIHTDTSLHAMQYIGPPYTFGFQQVGINCGLIGPHASVDVNGIAFWMGNDAFYMFDGTVKKIPCTVQDYVFDDFNKIQGPKTHVGLNSQFNEVTWWYCSFTSDYIDRFVTFNYLENVWTVGTLSRTAWADRDVFDNPLAASFDSDSIETPVATSRPSGLTPGRSVVWNQEVGVNGDGQAITSYIESGYFDIGEGDSMLLMRKFIPDFKEQAGDLTVNLFLRPYPQATASPSSLDPYTVTPTTQKVDTRARGRQIAVKITSDELNSNWRYGTMRVDIQPDGLR
jgi:hypothetical protein